MKQFGKFARIAILLAATSLLAPSPTLFAQNPQTDDVPAIKPTQPLVGINSRWTNGTSAGYWPTAGAGLTLNLGSGTSYCGTTLYTYAGGTIGLTASSTNLVYIDPNTLAAPAAPALGSTAGGSLAAATYFAKVTYLNGGGETVASAESSLAVAANNLLVVTSPASSGNAMGYNVYISTTTGTETKQNASRIAIGTNWTEPTSGLISGSALPSANSTTCAPAASTASSFSAGQIPLATVVTGASTITTIADNRTFFVVPPSVAVSSVFGRIGAVTAQSGDYTASQVTNAFDLSANNNIGTHYYDIGTQAAPANPASGFIRLYGNSTSGNLACLTSSGASCIPTTGSNFADAEVPSGGTGTAFTLAHTPNPAASLILVWDGLIRKAGNDFTIAGANITTSVTVNPAGDNLQAWYRW